MPASPGVDPASNADLERLLAENKVVIVDFYATWCGPCKAYSPKFQRIEREMRRAFPDAKVAFLSIDVDRNHDVSREARVMSVPTTVAWTMGRTLFGRPKRKELLRFSGDRAWPEMVRSFTKLLDEHAA